jgi:hypothetical protein
LLFYAITPKAQEWIKAGEPAYLGSRYAYVGVTMACAALIVMLNKAVYTRATAAIAIGVLIASAVAIVSIYVSWFNGRVAWTMRLNMARWEVARAIGSCQLPPLAAPQAPVAAPRLWNVVGLAGFPVGYDDYWTTFLAMHYARKLTISNGVDSVRRGTDPLFLDFRVDSKSLDTAVILRERGVGSAPDRLYLMIGERHDEVALSYQESGGMQRRVLSPGMELTHCAGYRVYELFGKNIDMLTLSLLGGTFSPLGLQVRQLSYDLGATVSFSRDGDGIRLLNSGWSTPERWGTWSEAKEASLLLGLSSVPANGAWLTAGIHAFVNERHPNLTVNVVVNGVPVGRWSFNAGQPNQEPGVRIPVAVLKKQRPVEILFQISTPVSPLELGLSGDGRPLGIGLKWMQLRPMLN